MLYSHRKNKRNKLNIDSFLLLFLCQKMINNYLTTQIKGNFPYLPTSEQENVLNLLAGFLLRPSGDTVFLLKGYAGTGKTSLVSALVRTLDGLQQKCVLLAPTGRAAKVFSGYAGHPAYTIHKKIYRQRSFSGDMGSFALNDNLTTHTLYIVDEASMIANEGSLSGTAFGTGRLLDDLVHFVYSGQGCRLLLLGDTAQLPPVGEDLSPALFAEALRGYGLDVVEAELTQVVRQGGESGILWNATRLRRLIADDECWSLPKVRVTGFADIRVLPGDELVDASGREHIYVSAKTGYNMDKLLEIVDEQLFGKEIEGEFLVPYDRGDVVSYICDRGTVVETDYTEKGTKIRARLSQEAYGKVREYDTL